MQSENSVISRAQFGMDTPQVTVETHLPGGLPGFTLVGLPETAVREARDRVKSALQNCGFDFPRGRVVVNLAPADLVKEGGRFDLAIAVSILCATGQLDHHKMPQFEFLGELSLYGEVRPVRGSLCAALAVSTRNDQASIKRALVLPKDNLADVTALADSPILALDHLQNLQALVQSPEAFQIKKPPDQHSVDQAATNSDLQPSLDDIHGQQGAKRALAVAAAGGHHLLMVGPPGTGKTMLARRLVSLLPALETQAALESAAVYSAAGLKIDKWARPPFREPHHSASAPALVGGGSHPRPGEISLAHQGLLFLDELPHFKPSVLNLLREPLESASITVARTKYKAIFPANFQLVAAMNPCPAGQHCEQSNCRCSTNQVRTYQSRVSGPLLDRIDLQVSVPALPNHLLFDKSPIAHEETHQFVKQQVARARSQQLGRQGGLNGKLNADDLTADLTRNARSTLLRATDKLKLSARSAHKMIKVSRTIADLADDEKIDVHHIAEALSYRQLNWQDNLGIAG